MAEPFRFDSLPHDFVGSISQLMQAGPEARAQALMRVAQYQADAQRQQGQIAQQLAGTLGGIVGGIPGQLQKNREADQMQQERAQRLALGNTQLDQAQQGQRANEAVNSAAAASSDPTMQPQGPSQTTPNGVVPQLPNILGKDGLFDIPATTQFLASRGLTTQSGDLIKSLDQHNEALVKFQQGQQAQLVTKNNAYARAASSMGKALDLGVPYDAAAKIFGDSLLSGGLPQSEVQNKLQELGQLDPKTQRASLDDMAGRYVGKTETVAPGAAVVGGPDGKTVLFQNAPKAENPAFRPEAVMIGGKPAQVAFDVHSGKYFQNGVDVTEKVQPKSAEKSRQAEWGVLGGKTVAIAFDPATGKRYDADGNDVTSTVKPVPPASIQINNANAATAAKPIEEGSREYRAAQDLAYGKLTFNDFTKLYPSRGSGPQAALRAAVYDKARELNPAFDVSQFEAGFKMFQNPAIRQRLVAIDSLGPVIDQISELAKQADLTDIPAMNRLLASAKFNIGDTTITNYRQLQTLLGDEVGNALGVGSGSDMKTKMGLDLVNPNLSPANFVSTMQQLKSVLGARKLALLGTMGPYGQSQTGGADTPPPFNPPKVKTYNPKTGKLE